MVFWRVVLTDGTKLDLPTDVTPVIEDAGGVKWWTFSVQGKVTARINVGNVSAMWTAPDKLKLDDIALAKVVPL